MKDSYKESFEKTKKAGEIAAGALDEVAKIIRPGIRTDYIDKYFTGIDIEGVDIYFHKRNHNYSTSSLREKIKNT